MTYQQGLLRARALLALGVLLVGGCSSSSDEAPKTLDGWQRTASWPHEQVIPFDNVATASYRHTVAWVRRPSDDPLALDYWQIVQGGEPERVSLPPPTDVPLAIPVALTQESHRWLAAAVTREQPGAANTGIVIWQGDGTTDDQADLPVSLEPPGDLEGVATFAEVSAARSPDATVVVATTRQGPVIWRQSAADNGEWTTEMLDLDVEVASLRVAGDANNLVLAGVDHDGRGHVWTSPTGEDWTPLDRDELPGNLRAAAGSATVLTPLGQGDLLAGWMADSSANRGAIRVTVQRIVDGEITTVGTIDATDEKATAYERIDITDATLDPDGEVIVVGEGLRSDGSSVPLMWAHYDDSWAWAEQENLTNRVDHRLRAIATTGEGDMVALLGHLSFADVEAWQWVGSE